MTSNEQLAAVFINNFGSSLAGFVAAEMVEKPMDGEPVDFDLWKTHFEQRFTQLRAALVMNEPELLTNEVRWSQDTFSRRGLPPEALGRALDLMGTVVREKLPTEAAQAALVYLDQASRGLVAQEPAKEILEASKPTERSSLEYLELVLKGESSEAIARLVQRLDEGTDLFALYEDILLPAQNQVGTLWHSGNLSIAEEHFCTQTTRQAMAVLSFRARAKIDPLQKPRGTVVAAATVGNSHVLPLQVLSDFFEIKGWRSILLGQPLPPIDLIEGIRAFEADLLLVSAALAVHLPELKETISAVRESEATCGVRILIGGRAFEAIPDLWKKLGADGYAPSARMALEEADRLFR